MYKVIENSSALIVLEFLQKSGDLCHYLLIMRSIIVFFRPHQNVLECV